MDYELKLNNKQLFEFYTTNRLDFLTMNIFLMNLLLNDSQLHLGLDKKLDELKAILTANQQAQSLINSNVTEIVKKFDNASSKGNMSEHITYNILVSLFPCAQIDHVGNEIKESGDIIFQRNGKPKILIENKDHDSKNVPKHEVDKFIRDCETQSCCGIMFAQHRGISNKDNFELQVHNGNVLLYIHEVKFDNDKIKIAIEIVEQFKMKLDEIGYKDEDCAIDKETLDEINKEFGEFLHHKTAILKSVKDVGEKIGDLKFPCLEKYLSSRYAYSFNQQDTFCKYCEKTVSKSITHHYRYCTAKHKNSVDL